MICIPIIADTMDSALKDIKLANAEPADLLELRIDFIKNDLDIEGLLKAADKPCLVTCRAEREGGNYTDDEDKRIKLLQEAARLGAAYIDIESDAIENYTRENSEKVICSTHNFIETPADLAETVKNIEKSSCDIVKFAVTANSLKDNITVWNIMADCKKPVIGLCMGELGEVSRILAILQGGLLTFGALQQGLESAPGQITARDMAELYNVNNITRDTKLYAVVGNPIAHSVSPEIHNSAFRKLGLDCTYLKFKVEDLGDFLKDFEFLDLQGISVTIPHKHAAFELSDKVDPVAEKIGAVNTLSRKDNLWHGDNTDCKAALAAIVNGAAKAGISIQGAKALMLGAGGAARGICYGLKEEGVRITITNRTIEKAEKLAEELGAEVIPLDKLTEAKFDIIANSTSVGMHPNVDASPVPKEIIHKDMVAFDAIYNPRITRFLNDAKNAGAEIADGVEMFVGQAVRQFEIWREEKAPVDIMEEIVVRRLTK
ncbi:MAG: shikimate dehydrogenase [Planctomycetota bacterium]